LLAETEGLQRRRRPGHDGQARQGRYRNAREVITGPEEPRRSVGDQGTGDRFHAKAITRSVDRLPCCCPSSAYVTASAEAAASSCGEPRLSALNGYRPPEPASSAARAKRVRAAIVEIG
jgi:hypothetical protein